MKLFRRISYRLALQFTAFVFALFLINGIVFLAADFSNASHQLSQRLLSTTRMVGDELKNHLDKFPATLPPSLRARLRLVTESGEVVYSGNLFEGVPFTSTVGMQEVRIEDEEYIVLTSALSSDTQNLGYLQVAELKRLQFRDLPLRTLLYLLGSVAVSVLTFLVGMRFSRNSLRPAEETMQRLEQFTQDASHELRTPLAALSSSLDLALQTRKYQEGILSAKDDLAEVAMLLERLLELARLDQLALVTMPVDLSALVTDTCDRLRPLAAERSVTITCNAPNGIRVHGDPSLLRQLLTNLLQNAIKFSKPHGGTVTVTLTKKTLSVADEGIGIPATALGSIFDRFFQAEGSRTNDGYGLGLAMVKRIVDIHGWHVRVESTQGVGTRFLVDF